MAWPARRVARLVPLVAVGACFLHPAPQAPPPPPATMQLGVPRLVDSTRAFFDSLSAARQPEGLIPPARPLPSRSILGDTSAAVAWMDILRDTVLVELVRTAVRQNRDVQTALARIREYRADVGIARGPQLPTVALNASASTNRIAFGTLGISYNALVASANVAWELDFWGRIRHNVEAATGDLAAQEAAERGTVLTLVSDVATGYLQLLELDQERAVARQTLASRQATLDLARQRYAQGVISELDVRQFEAQVAEPAVTLAQTERLSAQAEHNLNVLLGQLPGPIPRGQSLTIAVSALVVPDSIPSAFLERRPDVREAERTFDAAAARVQVTQAARMPTFNITGQYGSQAGVPGNLFQASTQIYQLSLGMSFPLFNNGALASQEAAAQARAEQAAAQLQQTILNAARDANDALVAVRSTRDETTAQATQVSALRRALDLAQSRYTAGVSSYLDLLDAQRSLYTAELALGQAQMQQLTAAVQLYRAIGGSWTK